MHRYRALVVFLVPSKYLQVRDPERSVRRDIEQHNFPQCFYLYSLTKPIAQSFYSLCGLLKAISLYSDVVFLKMPCEMLLVPRRVAYTVIL